MKRWIMKLMVLPIWLAVTLLLLLFKVVSNLSSVVIGLAMLLGIVLGVVAAIRQRWTDVAILACCKAAILLLQVAAVAIELLLEAASERLGIKRFSKIKRFRLYGPFHKGEYIHRQISSQSLYREQSPKFHHYIQQP